MCPATLHIRLFGHLDLRRGGTPLPALESARAESLLAYLLLHRGAPQPRQRLAFLLWPDSTEPQARTNLRHLLHTLRRAVPNADDFLEVGARTLGWRGDSPFWLDVASFEHHLSRAQAGAASDAAAALRDAVDLYRGDLLAASYDEWLIGERERLRSRYLEALERLTALLDEAGRHAEAISYAERLLRQDPLREDVYRLLMRLHDAAGDRARAVRVYHACAATLQRELGVEPAAPTREAYEALLFSGDPGASRPQAHPTARVAGTPLIARTAEWAQVTAAWRQSERGGSRLLLVTGEPGVGKTRLVEELRSWCAHRGAAVAEARCYPVEGALTYGPVVTWLRSETFESRLDRLDLAHLTELARLLPELLVSVPALTRPEPLPANEQRQRVFDAVTQALLAADVPVLLVADDLQWADRETLQLLHYLLRVRPGARLMVAAAARREDIDEPHPVRELVAGLRVSERITEIELGRLGREDTALLAARITGRPLDPAEAERLHDETEGNPLFVVEALRAGWPRDGAPRWITPKVQAVIEARLAQLSEPARSLVELAATVGRAFTADVLAAASDAAEEALVPALDELWRRGIVREDGADGYDFTHDKIREVATVAQSPARRRRHHLRVARALERLHRGDPDAAAARIAAHYEQAGAANDAIPWFERAAEAAQRLHASAEAARLLGRAAALIPTLPATPERDARELQVVSALVAPLAAIEGYASPGVVLAHDRALELLGPRETEAPSPLLRSLALAALTRGDFDAAQHFGGEIRARGAVDADGVLIVEGEYVLGVAAFWQGQLIPARAHLEAAVASYREEHRAMHLLRYAQDPKVVCLSRLANTLWFLGAPRAATRARDDAVALADDIGDPVSKGIALTFAAVLALDMGSVDDLRVYHSALRALSERLDSRPVGVVADALGPYVDLLDGRAGGALDRIARETSDVTAVAQAPGVRALLGRLLVAACRVADDPKAGLAAADRALATQGGTRVWEPEVVRVRAEFMEALGAFPPDIERELRRALDTAREQGSSIFALRAAAGLMRHRIRHGDDRGAGTARATLAEMLASLPEPAEIPEAREAAALLAAP